MPHDNATFMLIPSALSPLRPRMLTNPDMPEVEKLSTTKVPAEFLDSASAELPSVFGGQSQSHVNNAKQYVVC